MKLLTKINNKDNIIKYLDYTDGLILGLKDFSVDYYEFELDEIKEIVLNNTSKDIFIAINKNIFNNELNILENILKELDKISVSGILFYDMSILYLKRKNNLKINLVWNQTHMVTNYNTCNYYYEKGCKYAFVSGELTLDEINEISNNTRLELMTLIAGHQVMSHSRRKLLTNYYSSINKKLDNNIKEISEREEKFIIKESNSGSTFKTTKILNAIPYLDKLSNISYCVIDEDFIDYEDVISLLKLSRNIINNKEVEKSKKLSIDLIGDETSFLFKKTIYRVKGDK